MKYWIHPDAALEHQQQIDFYEERQPGLGKRYHEEFRRAVALACEAPHRFRVVRPPDIRRVGIRIFHFDLIFREVDGSVQILAIAPHRRQPNYWRARK